MGLDIHDILVPNNLVNFFLEPFLEQGLPCLQFGHGRGLLVQLLFEVNQLPFQLMDFALVLLSASVFWRVHLEDLVAVVLLLTLGNRFLRVLLVPF